MIVPLGRTSILEVGLYDWGGASAVYANPPDFPEMLVWQARLKTNDLFVDVGANVGLYSIFAGDCGAKVIAVEPGPIERLQRNATINHLEVEIVHAAASNHSGTERFDPRGDAVAHLGASGIEVPAITLDDLIGDRIVAGVKIDVEGAERLVIEGATRSLQARRIQCLQLEWNNTSLDNFGESRNGTEELLTELGYGLFRPTRTGELRAAPGATIGRDVFALPLE